LVASRYNRMLPAVFRLVRSVQHQPVVPMASDLRLFAIEYPSSMRSRATAVSLPSSTRSQRTGYAVSNSKQDLLRSGCPYASRDTRPAERLDQPLGVILNRVWLGCNYGPMSLRHLLKVLPVAILFVACGGGSDTYTSEMEAEYLEACIEEAEASLLNEIDIDSDTASDVAADYCECTWSEITSILAVEDFEEMDADISAGGAMPAEINAIIETCAESVFLSL